MSKPAIKLIENIRFYEAWGLLLEQLEQIQNPEQCKECLYEGFCSKCPGVLSAECGDCSNVNDAFCNNAKRLYEVFWERKNGIQK